MTPRGKNAYNLKKGLEGLQVSLNKKRVTKQNIIQNATKKLKPKKILHFHKGRSISKPKTSNFKLRKELKREHSEELKENRLKITNEGKFKNA